MRNPICISTGFLYRIVGDFNERISKIKEFLPAGVELIFAYPRELFNFVITKENLVYLRSLRFNSIHAPGNKKIRYGNNQKSKKALEIIETLYKKIKARNVVFHKEDINDINSLKNYDFVATIENGDWRKTCGNTIAEIETILKENKNLKFTFDFGHALTISPDEIPLYINKFNDRLVEIHLSWINQKINEHWFLHKYDCQKTPVLLNYLNNINVPVVLECVALNKNQVQLIRKEIEYIKKV